MKKLSLKIRTLLSSTAALFSIFLILLALFVSSVLSLRADTGLHSVQMADLRLATWNVARLGLETTQFETELRLAEEGQLNAVAFMQHYDILWSRFDYLLVSTESHLTRLHGDNLVRIRQTFATLKAMEPEVLEIIENEQGPSEALLSMWSDLRWEINRLLIDNFTGSDATALMSGIDDSRTQLLQFRTKILIALSLALLWLLAVVFVLRRQNRFDALTGLPNQNFLAAYQPAKRAENLIACQIMDYREKCRDLHDSGSEMLTRAVIKRLQRLLNKGDKLIYLTNDEFVILTHYGVTAEGLEWQEALQSEARFNWRYQRSTFAVQLVFGISHRSGANAVCAQRTKQAMMAKQFAIMTEQSVQYYRDEFADQLALERGVVSALIDFLNNEPSAIELSCRYQPIVTNHPPVQIGGVEVLLRGQHREFGYIAPNKLVDLCERNGLGRKLGLWIMNRAREEIQPLIQNGLYAGRVSINLNPSLISRELVDDIQREWIDKGTTAHRLCLEITEDNAVMQFKTVNELITLISETGACFALDDFGTGRSSLEYVRELKIDRLKIDRCFVTGIDHSRRSYMFLKSLLALSRQLNLDVVVEGVETEAEWKALATMGEVHVQGYYQYKPLTLEELSAVLVEKGPAASASNCVALARAQS